MALTFRRTFWLLTIAIFVFTTSNCGTTRMYSVDDELAREGSDLHKKSGQKIEGFTLRVGSYHGYHGRVTRVGQDSLAFYSERDQWEFGGEIVTDVGPRYAVSEVSELRIRHTNTVSTVFAVFGVLLLLAAIAGVVVAATKESCPFIYSYDGERYVFDGEPYGGATMSSLERTDYSELEHLRATDGSYRLLITNEVDETQHTNCMNLLVADHPEQTRAVMDVEGRLHCFSHVAPLIAANDENDSDLMVWLRDDDYVAWYPDLAAYAANDTLTDTRNHITLEFMRPAGTDSVFLITDAITGQWGSHMIRVMLSMRGNRVQDFYDAINGSIEYQNQLAAWNEREDLFVLGLELQESDRWVRRGTIHGGGPFISENRAIPLDLSRAVGDTVRLRINPPISFWRLNSFHLAWGEEPFAIEQLDLVSARDEKERDVRQLLIANDDAYLDFPTNDEWAELVFAEPPSVPGLKRTIFAKTTGWYEIHLYANGPPDTLGLIRLRDEAGYAVTRALQEFADFQRTGELAYIKQGVTTP